MKPKKRLNKKEQVDYWIQLYLDAKQKGDSKIMKACESIINKLGGKISRL
jgi:hypothetical protein